MSLMLIKSSSGSANGNLEENPYHNLCRAPRNWVPLDTLPKSQESYRNYLLQLVYAQERTAETTTSTSLALEIVNFYQSLTEIHLSQVHLYHHIVSQHKSIPLNWSYSSLWSNIEALSGFPESISSSQILLWQASQSITSLALNPWKILFSIYSKRWESKRFKQTLG